MDKTSADKRSKLASKLIRMASRNPNQADQLITKAMQLNPRVAAFLRVGDAVKVSGCEKLPEGPMRDNCEKKSKESTDHTAGCEKLPEGPMRDNCEKKSKEGAEKWIQDAIKEPGALHKALGIPEDEDIPMSTINAEIKKIKDKEDKTDAESKLLKQLNLAKTLKTKVKKAMERTAINKETEEFVQWALNTQDPWAPGEVASFVNRQLGIKTSPPIKRRTGPRFQRWDMVEIKKDKHKDRSTIGPYEQFNGKIGTVVDTDGNDVMVAFKGQPAPIRFPDGLKRRGVGIYKYTPPFEIEGSQKIEMIYMAGGKPSEDAKATVEVYSGRGGQSEQRSANYYTGHVTSARTGGKGWYFQAIPQQRLRVDPAAQGGYQFRTFNPAVGQVMYVGIFGKRPSNWKAELEGIVESANEEAEGL